MVIVKIAAYAELRDVNFVGAKHVAGTADGVVFGMRKVVHIVDVRANFWSEERGRVGRVLGACVTCQPGEIGESKGLGFAMLSGGRLRRSGDAFFERCRLNCGGLIDCAE